jgi:hypothetical protein
MKNAPSRIGKSSSGALDDPKKSSEWADRVMDAWKEVREVTNALDKLQA